MSIQIRPTRRRLWPVLVHDAMRWKLGVWHGGFFVAQPASPMIFAKSCTQVYFQRKACVNRLKINERKAKHFWKKRICLSLCHCLSILLENDWRHFVSTRNSKDRPTRCFSGDCSQNFGKRNDWNVLTNQDVMVHVYAWHPIPWDWLLLVPPRLKQ